MRSAYCGLPPPRSARRRLDLCRLEVSNLLGTLMANASGARNTSWLQRQAQPGFATAQAALARSAGVPLESVLATTELDSPPIAPARLSGREPRTRRAWAGPGEQPAHDSANPDRHHPRGSRLGVGWPQPRHRRWPAFLLAGDRGRLAAAHRRRHAARLQSVRGRARPRRAVAVPALRTSIPVSPSGRRVPAGAVSRPGPGGRHDLGRHADRDGAQIRPRRPPHPPEPR